MGMGGAGVFELHAKRPFLSAPFVMFSNLKNNFQMLRHFISRDLKVRYHNSFIGYGWSLLEPLALTITFYILFAILSDDKDPYRPLTILLGILAWSLFARTLTSGTVSLQRNSSMIKRVYFPREMFMFSKCGYQLIQISLSLFVIIPLLWNYDLMPTINILLLPIGLVLIAMLALSLAFFTSILQTKARDMEHLVTVGVRISFYLTPVFYPLNMITGGRIPAQYADLYLYLNPMATYITMIRSAFTGDELGIPQHNLIFTIFATVILFWIGSIYFMRNERRAVKNL